MLQRSAVKLELHLCLMLPPQQSHQALSQLPSSQQEPMHSTGCNVSKQLPDCIECSTTEAN